MPIEYRTENRTAIITINNPEVLNAVGPDDLMEMTGMLRDYSEDRRLRACIITGAGEKAFCTGMDLKSVIPDGKGNAAARPENTLVRGLTVEKPVIAAVNGYALGGGFELALACDLRIAAETAIFGLPEATLGLIPGWGGTQRLSRLIPFGKAMEMIMTGQRIDAVEAGRLFLVNKVVPQRDLMNEAKMLAAKLCDISPTALRAVKQAVYGGSDMAIEDGLALESRLSAHAMASKDFIEGRTAFLEKRKPVFSDDESVK